MFKEILVGKDTQDRAHMVEIVMPDGAEYRMYEEHGALKIYRVDGVGEQINIVPVATNAILLKG